MYFWMYLYKAVSWL